jgi:hypothetical protein
LRRLKGSAVKVNALLDGPASSAKIGIRVYYNLGGFGLSLFADSQ